MTRRKQEDAAELMRRALAALGAASAPAPANDDTIDEEALRERMHRVAEKLRRARNR